MGEFTIRDLAAELRLGLRLLAPDGGDESASSARTRATSHPARYVLPGELVLTNGLWLDDVAPEVDLRGRRPARSASGRPEQRAPGRPGAGRGGVRGSELPLIKCPDDLFSLVWARPRAHHRRGERRAAPAGWTRRLSSGSRRQRPRGAARANRRRTGLTAAFVGGRADHRHGDGSPSRDGQARLFRGAAASFLARSPIGSASRRADAAPVSAPSSRRRCATFRRARLLVGRSRPTALRGRRSRALGRRTMTEELIALVLADLVGETAFETRVRCSARSGAADRAGRPTFRSSCCTTRPRPQRPTRSRSSVVAAAPARGSRARAAGGDRRRGPRRRRASDGLRRPAVGARALRRSLVEASTALQPRARADTAARARARDRSHATAQAARAEQLDAYRNVVLGPLGAGRRARERARRDAADVLELAATGAGRRALHPPQHPALPPRARGGADRESCPTRTPASTCSSRWPWTRGRSLVRTTEHRQASSYGRHYPVPAPGRIVVLERGTASTSRP